MTSINTMIKYEDLDRALVEYKLDLFRYDAYTTKELMKRVTEANPIIKGLIFSINSETTEKEIKRIISEVKKISNDMFEKAYGEMSSEWKPFYQVANELETSIYNTWAQTTAFKKAVDISSIKPVINGISFDNWWKRTKESHNWRLEKLARNIAVGAILPADINKNYRSAIKETRRNVTSLARTGNAYIANKAREALEKRNADIIEYKQHFSTLDGRTTDICMARDQLKWTLSNEPIGHSFEFIMPPLHFGCRSLVRLIIKPDVKVFGTRASEFGQVEGAIDYNDWLKRQSVAYQNKRLGKKRADLFRSGAITVRDLVNQDGRSLTLKQLKDLYSVL